MRSAARPSKVDPDEPHECERSRSDRRAVRGLRTPWWWTGARRRVKVDSLAGSYLPPDCHKRDVNGCHNGARWG